MPGDSDQQTDDEKADDGSDEEGKIEEVTYIFVIDNHINLEKNLCI